MNRKLTIVLLLTVVALAGVLAGVQQASAFQGEIRACDGCHTISPSIKVTTSVTSITVSPCQSFVVGIHWSGGLTGAAGSTEVNWPIIFSNIGITRNNAQFKPTPRVPAPAPAGASGTTLSVLTAPAAVGTYIVRVYTSAGNNSGPDGTNFHDIKVTVKHLGVQDTQCNR